MSISDWTTPSIKRVPQVVEAGEARGGGDSVLMEGSRCYTANCRCTDRWTHSASVHTAHTEHTSDKIDTKTVDTDTVDSDESETVDSADTVNTCKYSR